MRKRQSPASHSRGSPETPPLRRRISSLSPSTDSPNSILFNIKSSTKPSSPRFNRSSLSNINLSATNHNFSRLRSPPSASKSLTSISDLKSLASSSFHDLKRLTDRSHSEIVKEIEGGNSRLHKRFKMQVQSSQQNMDEVDKECKDIAEQISETQKAMEATYVEFMEDAQATASRLCKTAIPELSKSFDEAINALRCRFGVSSA